MRKIDLSLLPLCLVFCALLGSGTSLAGQFSVQRCYTGPAIETNGTVASSSPISFTPGVDFPASHVITNIEVEVTWSFVAGGCTAPNPALPVDLAEVGFGIQSPLGAMYFARSANNPSPGTPSWSSNTAVGTITTRFSNTGVAPSGAPVSGANYRTNADPFSVFNGNSPAGLWSLIMIDDVANAAALCVQSYCIRIFTCDPGTITAVCRTGTTNLSVDNAGILNIRFQDIDAGSDTSCGLNSVLITPNNFTCANLNTNHVVTMTLTDQFGFTASCNSTIRVVDTVLPVLTCQNYTINLGPGGTFVFRADTLVATDNCGTVTRRVNNLPNVTYTCAQAGGANNATFSATDPSGNAVSCARQITVIDPNAPNAVCRDIDVYLNAAGQASVDAIEIDGGSTVVCPFISARLIDGSASRTYTCADLGANPAVLTVVHGANGLTGTCNATVTVFDTISPVAQCQPVTAYLDAAGNVTVAATAVNDGSTDNCTPAGSLQFSIGGASSVSYNCSAVGTPQNVVLRVQDLQGNFETCNAVITVLDTISPQAFCQNITVFVSAGGTVSITGTDIDNNSIDVCSGTSLTRLVNGQPSFSFNCAQVNSIQTVGLTVRDASGNEEFCQADVEILDNINPVARCRANLPVFLDAAGVATVTAVSLDSLSTDNCGLPLTFSIAGAPQTSFACAQANTVQNVTLTVADASGNQHTCLASVVVRDTVRPVANCQNVTVNLSVTNPGTVTVNASQINNSSTDNCGSLSFLINGQPSVTYNCANTSAAGNAAILTVTDASGNQRTCNATVFVVDDTDPVAICRNITVNLGTTGTVSVSPADIRNALSFDNCAITGATINNQASFIYNCTDLTAVVGLPRTATLRLTDAAGNVGTCDAQVTVVDNIAPSAQCNNIDVFLDATGNVVVPAVDLRGATSLDNCGIVSTTVNGGQASVSFGCADIFNLVGPNIVVLELTDASGLTGTCNAEVRVRDNIAPTAVCQAVTVNLNASGVAIVNASQIDGGSTDNCPAGLTLTINGAPDFTYDCGDLGTNSALLTVTDAAGNNAFCTADVTVVDNIAPNAICHPTRTLNLSATTGTVTLLPTQVNNGSSDNCGSLTFSFNGLPSRTFNCTNVGTPVVVNLRVTDASGNTATCPSTITVVDVTPPTINCNNPTVFVGAGGTVTVLATALATASDNCGAPTRTIVGHGASIAFNCTDINTTVPLTIQATDASGLTNTCTANVTVRDTLRPTALCRPATLQLNASGQATLTTLDVDNGSTDNCGPVSLALSRTNFSCADLGTTQLVTLTVTDPSNNVRTCQAQVEVEDNIAPQALCFNSRTVYLNAAGVATITAVQLDSASTDNCAIFGRTINGNPSISFDCSQTGNQVVTLQVEDTYTNTSTCDVTVIVRDTTAPLITCAPFSVDLDNNGVATVLATQIATATDNCPGVSLSIGGLTSVSYSCANTGNNPVTVVATDASGVTASCATTVTVNDVIAPTANCQPTLSVNLDINGQATITSSQIDNSSVDNCSIVSYVLSQTSFDCTNLGSTNVTMTVTDPSGNSSACATTVTINDAIAPTAVCNPDTLYLGVGPNPTVTLTPLMVDGGSTDNCNITGRLINGQASLSFDCSNIGTTAINLQVTDQGGLSNTCATTVTVLDTIRPQITCTSPTVNLSAVGQATVNASALITATDNCAAPTTRFQGGSTSQNFDCTQVGANNFVMEAEDAAGNIVSCPVTVTIADVTPPTAGCQNITVSVGNTGVTTIVATDINNGSNDACGLASLTVSPSTVGCAQVGSNVPVVLTVTDNNGLQATCNANVTVVDNTPPTVACQNITVFLDNAGQVVVNAQQIDNGSADSCGIASYLINGQPQLTFTCLDTVAPINVTLTVTDVNGQSATCPATVTVRDNTPPTAICRATFSAFLDNTGQVVVTPANIDSASMDNCGLNLAAFRLNGQPQLTYNCTQITTPQNVTLTVVDNSGLTATCTSIITVRDTLPPVASCIAAPLTLTLSPTAPATVTLNATALNDGSTDNCGPLTFRINGQATQLLNCANRGTNNIVLTVTDGQGLSSTCTAVVEVVDATNPVANCRTTVLNVNLDSTGIVRVPAINLNNNSTDNCGVVSYQVGGQDTITYTCANIGNNLAVLVVRDAQGNQAQCNATINVRDNIAPVAVCYQTPVDVYLGTNGLVTVTAAEIDSASLDNCNIVSRLINGSPSRQYSCANVNTLNSVTLTVSDGNSSTNCTAQVRVLDTISPVAQCQNITVNLNAQGFAVVSATSINNNSTDNCQVLNLRINGMLQDTFDCGDVNPLGVQAVLSMEDPSGNTSFCNATVTVVDNLAPTITCTPFTAYLDAAGAVAVQATEVATGIDNCGIFSWTINGQPSVSYNCGNITGTNSVTITAVDLNGNPASCQTTVTVRDTIIPEAFCRATFTANLDNSGQVTVTAAQIDNGSIDNCAVDQIFLNGAASVTYNCANIGNNTATLRVVDESGNEAFCTTVIEVLDIIPPTAQCVANLDVFISPAGTATVTAQQLDNGSTDACGPLLFLVNGQPALNFNCTNVGNQTVTLTVIDRNGAGLSSQCNVPLNIQDTVPPVARCRNITVDLNNAGTVQVTPAQIDGSPLASSDNCGIATYQINTANFVTYDCSHVGTTQTATLRIVDVYGNPSTCTADIIVRDITPPVVVCQNITVNVTASGPRTLTPTDLDPGNGTNDACGIDSMYVMPSLITCEDALRGQIPVTLYAVDNNGNIDSCTSLVTVILAQPAAVANPAVLCEGEDIQFSANPPASGLTYSYNWTGPAGFTSTQANPLISNVTGVETGVYFLTLTPSNGTGCPVYDTVTVFVNVVEAPIVNANVPLCEGSEGVVVLQNANQYSGTNISFQWYFNNAPLAGQTNDSLFLGAVSLTDAGDYAIVVEVDGCRDSNRLAPFNLVINTLPAAPQPRASNPCEGEALSLLATPQDSSRTYTYLWNGPAGFNSTNADPVLSPVSQANAGVYSLTITDANTCTATASVQASIRQTPAQPVVEFNAPLCIGELLELFTATTYPLPVSYEWILPDASRENTNIAQLILTDAAAGVYSLQVSMNGCNSTLGTVDVRYEAAPVANDDAFTVAFRDSLVGLAVIANDQFGSGFTIAVLNPTSNGLLTNNANGTFDYTPNFSFFGRDSFSYVICDALCPNSCDTALVTINVTTEFECFIPNGISPNGDGINDVFTVRCVNDYPNATLQIFSRWGNRVYEGPLQGFEGQFQGRDLPDGTYFYLINLNDRTHVANDQFSGYLIIQR